jgi:hypothetical protein
MNGKDLGKIDPIGIRNALHPSRIVMSRPLSSAEAMIGWPRKASINPAIKVVKKNMWATEVSVPKMQRLWLPV